MTRIWLKRILAAGAVVFVILFVWGSLEPGVGPMPPAPGTPGMPRMVQLGSPACFACQLMAPFLEEIQREQKGKIEIHTIDVGNNAYLQKRYQVEGLPTQLFYGPEGDLFWRHEGFLSKEEILETFEKYGIRLAEWKKKK